MISDLHIVFGVLAVTVILFVTDRFSLELVALASLLALLLTGVLEPGPAVAGFADPVVLMIAGLFVVGAGIFETGVADRLGRWLGRVAGNRELRLITFIMLVTAPLSALMSSTGTVALMLPVAVMLARGAGLHPGRLLIPLAFASLLGGMLTLIGTAPNIVVSNELRNHGQEPFRFFAFAPVGLVVLAVGVGYMLLLGRRLLPRHGRVGSGPTSRSTELRSAGELVDDYELDDNILRFRVTAASGLAGKSLAEADVRRRFQGTVLGIECPGKEGAQERPVAASTVLLEDDILVVQVGEAALDGVKRREAALLEVDFADGAPLPRQSLLAEVLLTPRSRLVGRSLRDVRFRDRYHANVLSVRRSGRPLAGNAADVLLRFGDAMLVHGRRRDIGALRDEARDFVVVAEPRELSEPVRNTRRAPVAIAIMLGMLLLMTFGVVANVTAVLLAAFAMVATGCLTPSQGYRSISGQSVVSIAAILPMATALEQTGGIRLMVDELLATLGGAGPLAVMASLFVLTSVFSQVMSNTATTVLVAPIAYRVAVQMDASPQAFLMAVAIAASTAFCTPIASPVNTLVLSPGGYRFLDFVKVGVPLQVLTLLVTLIVVPMLF